MGQLQTTVGNTLEVLHPGMLNPHAGPDFSMARLVIDGIHWVGNVEIHVRSSEWMSHGHQHDPAYQQIILHVVYYDDRPVVSSSGRPFPTLVLQGRIDPLFIRQWGRLRRPYRNIPCEGQVSNAGVGYLQAFFSRLFVERLQGKMDELERQKKLLENDIIGLFYLRLFMSFGQKVNQQAFEQLFHHLPYKLLLRHKNRLTDLEALLFGVSGLLPAPCEGGYTRELNLHFSHWKRKYNLQCMKSETWRFARLRPNNFPTLRLAQLARVIQVFHQPLELVDPQHFEDALALLPHVEPAPYWRNHYRFGKSSSYRIKRMGERFIRHLAMNTLVPFRFFLERQDGRSDIDWVVKWFAEQPREDHRVVRLMVRSGFANGNGLQSQILYHLYTHYCSQQKCLNCHIGFHLLKSQ